MRIKVHSFKILLIFLCVIPISCAVPISPTGGPPDNTGPIVEFTVPETGTTNFRDNTFEFHFNEYINRTTVPSAITVEPNLGLEYNISWKRRTLYIDFSDDLPDSTTIIIKLGTNISDTRGNKIAAPVTLAISTGDEIDSGEISGRILLANDGRGAESRRVLLYRTPVNLETRANYEAQTDTGGTFHFSYLGEGSYQALLVDDRNRNKIWDQGSELAQPFAQEIIELDQAGRDTLDVLYTSEIDTLAPNILGVGLFSEQRMRLRFSEPVLYNEDAEIEIVDSLGNNFSRAYPLYISPNENFVLFAHSENPLSEDEEYSLSLQGINDPYGNSADTSGFYFTGSAQEDTTLQRIISANGQNGLQQDEAFTLTYAAPISEPELTDSVVVIEGDVDFDDWPEIETYRNQLIIGPQEEWIENTDYQFLVWNPMTQRRKMYSPEVWDSTEYGEIELTVSNVDSAATMIAQLLDADRNEIRREEFTQQILFSQLPPVSYTLIVYQDENGNGSWDRGTVVPYQAPEPYYVQRGLRVQEEFTSQIDVAF